MATLKSSDIKPNPNNPRIIKDDKFKKLVQSLKDFPEMAEVREVIVNKDHIILGGNMRYKAMIEAGWKDIPVRVVDWSEDKQKEFIIKDNISGGEWDWDILVNEWDTDLLDEWGLDLPETEPEEVEEDEAPEVSEDPPVSKLGEIYQLGRHRLMCGSATDFGQISDLLNGAIPALLFTDPPYGISIVGSNGGVGGGTEGKYAPIIGDDNTDAARESYAIAMELGIKDKIIWGGNYFTDFLPPSPCWLVWDKQGGKHVTFADVEMAWTSFDKPARLFTHIWDGFRRDSEQGEMRVHPTQKPVQLLVEMLTDYSARGSEVLDLFGGSGSTLIACEKMGRTCYMMELSPAYCDVIRKRYAKYTSPDDWEETWQEITPAVSGMEQA